MSNHLLSLFCFGCFLFLPFVLLAIRAIRPAFMPWLLAMVISAVLGWITINAAVHFYYAHLDDLIASYDGNAPQELRYERQADGAKLVFAWLFGWLYGLVYFAFWAFLTEMFDLADFIARKKLMRINRKLYQPPHAQ